eukprot:TRINITY_DN50774_c0_g1_i1.p1 TRINITY_DN50774_c0_g1~~TRINITY_DN50774_c0_g1_i1.p1  ORF type:complete len:441 (+),score=99.75 TRINITY_DN50774_c0_g1_i1:53-1375(+)
MGSGASRKYKGEEVVVCETKKPDTPQQAKVAPSTPTTAASPTTSPTESNEEDKCNELTAEPQYEGQHVATKGEESLACRTRRGSSLRYQTILKCDHFPSAQNQKLTERIENSPNFRQVEGSKVFGVGQAGVEGHLNVVKRMLETEGVDKVMWLNMREEPIIFINGLPYCVKDRKKPFGNQESTGIDTVIVERIEDDLVQEILAESKRYGGKILLHGETKPASTELAAWGEAYCYWETVTPESVMTVRSVADKLIAEGYPLVFHRVPITDENTPELKDFDQLLQCLASADPSTGLIFNCQLGRGRTTTGMAVALMLQRWISKVPLSLEAVPTPKDTFVAVQKIVSLVDGAAEGKAALDAALRSCAHMQHLHDAIVAKRGTKHAPVGVCYLERYIFMILLMVFANTRANGPFGGESFEEFVFSHSQTGPIHNILDHMTLDTV